MSCNNTSKIIISFVTTALNKFEDLRIPNTLAAAVTEMAKNGSASIRTIPISEASPFRRIVSFFRPTNVIVPLRIRWIEPIV